MTGKGEKHAALPGDRLPPRRFRPVHGDRSDDPRHASALNDEMEAAGVRVLGLGLSPASSAKSLRAQPDGKVRITDGPYVETKEHVGGLLVLKAANMDEALAVGAQGRLRRRPRCARFSGTTNEPCGNERPAPEPRKQGGIMPLYLVAVQQPDDFDPSTVTEAMIRDIDALNEELEASRRQDFRCRLLRGRQRKVRADAVRRQGAHHRRAVHGDQGARRRLLDRESRQPGRGAGVGAQGRPRLRAPVEVRPFLARTEEDNPHILGIGQG